MMRSYRPSHSRPRSPSREERSLRTFPISSTKRLADLERASSEVPHHPTEALRPGWEIGAQVGGGIGAGIGARDGYSFVPGLYAGGSLMHFFGNRASRR